MHVHQSLSDADGNNLFFDQSDPTGYNLAPLAKQFLAGIMKYAPEFCLVTNQYVNSYKRLIAQDEAPAFLSWGQNNRSAMVRIPGYRPNREDACRIELRLPDPAANPYLVFSAMLAAGLAGIEEGLTPPDPIENLNLFEHSENCLTQRGLRKLPEDLGEAIELFENSELMRNTLGEHIHSYLVKEKKAEWSAYLSTVSQWELDRYLAVL